MRHRFLARSFEVEDVVGIAGLNFAQRVKLYDGPAELSPGITLHPVGKHTPGVQFVRVHSSRAHAPSPHHIIPAMIRWSCSNTRRRGRNSKA